MNQEQLKKVIDCAISNSINYKTNSLLCDENLIQAAIFSYANKEYENQDEICDIYRNSLDSIKKRKYAIGSIPAWVPLVFVLGIALLAMEILTLVTFGFNIVFVFFMFLAFSLIGTGISYFHSTRTVSKAVKLWKKGVAEANTKKMISALKSIAKAIG